MRKTGEIITSDGREYRINDVIGRGASCIAYSAERSENGLVSACILKEYAPKDTDNCEYGRQRFIESGERQNQIRQYSCLNNQTPPVSCIFEYDNTVFIDVSCYNGKTLDRLSDISLPEYMRICRAIANTVGYYHKMGLLCLDLKPENIFVMQNTPEDTITQIVEFIDFDSIRKIGSPFTDGASYTRAWAAPEQINIYSGEITCAADVYAIGEIVFHHIFGRHSEECEHRGFSDYPYEQCGDFSRYITRPDVQHLLTKLFRNTIRSSPRNRFSDMKSVVKLLDSIIELLERKEFFVTGLPPAVSGFVGRDRELKNISEHFEKNSVLFINGVGGIGKSTIVRKFIHENRDEYDNILYLEYITDIMHTITDDKQLHISTIRRYNGESLDDYYERKLRSVKNICNEKKTLIVIDNYTDRVNRELSSIISLGYDTIVVTRNSIPENSYPVMTIDAIEDREELYRLISLNLGRAITEEEKADFDVIIGMTLGHTLLLELIARQIRSKKITVRKALELIRKEGFTDYSDDRIGNIKDGEETYDTIGRIISGLFSCADIDGWKLTILKTLSLLGPRGIETSLFCRIMKISDIIDLIMLEYEGWIYQNARVRVHPVIAEAVRSWKWPDISNEEIMNIYSSVVDIYSGFDDAEQIKTVIRDSRKYVSGNPLHYNIAVYYDMLGTYYDVKLAGRYITINSEEEHYLKKLYSSIEKAVSHMEKAKCSMEMLVKMYLSEASVLIRSYPEYKQLAELILEKTRRLLKKDDNENICGYFMTKAWYSSICERDHEKTKKYLQKAHSAAVKALSTELELIDVIYIPSANCLYNDYDHEGSIRMLNEAIEICEKYPDALSYIDKKAHLLNCLIDVYYDMKDTDMCRQIIAEIDEINDMYEDRGIFRAISDNIREEVN